MDDLYLSTKEIDMAVVALNRAAVSCVIDERLRCLNGAMMHIRQAHDMIVGWRTGQAPKPEPSEDERQNV